MTHWVLKHIGIQFVPWWDWPTLKWWHYPYDYSAIGHPIFWGLYLGVFEIRYFPNHKELK